MNNQTITIIDRKEVCLTSIKNVISFNENEFLVETPFGNLKITGKNLAIGKMDTEKQELNIRNCYNELADIRCLQAFTLL